MADKVDNSLIDMYRATQMPPQKLSENEKTLDWRKRCVDAIIGLTAYSTFNGRPTRYRKQVNWNLLNSKFDERDIEYVTNPFGIYQQGVGTPAKAEMFNLIKPQIEVLKGEELKRPFNFRAVGLAGEIVTVREQQKKELIGQMLQQVITKPLTTDQQDEQGNPIMKPLFNKLMKDFETNYEDTREILINKLLRAGYLKEKLEYKFNKGWEHALVAAEEVYYTGIVSGEPTIRTVNTLRFDYDRLPDMDKIQDAQWCKEERYLSAGQILDEFRQFMTEDEISRIDKGLTGANWRRPTELFGMYTSENTGYTLSDNIYDYSMNPNTTYYHSSHILVTTVCWRSMRKIGFLTIKSSDNPDRPEYTIVDETFKLPKNPLIKIEKNYKDDGSETYSWIMENPQDPNNPDAEPISISYELEWQWINDIWEGTRIGTDIYVNIRPLPNQIVDTRNPSKKPLPYIGRIYNATNAEAMSVVDFLKPIQYTYIIVWYRLMTELAKAKGKKVLFDVAAIPKSQGIDMEKWMYYFDNLGIAWVNSFEEGSEGASAGRSAVSVFNQYKEFDLTLSQSVQQYIGIIDKLEEMAGTVTGVNRQRQGQSFASDTVGTTQNAMVQSSFITESYFYIHNECKGDVLEQMIHLYKIAYKEGGYLSYMLSETERLFLQVDGDLLNDSEYGIFIVNSTKENQTFETVKGLATQALNSGANSLREVFKVIKSNSLAEVENIVDQAEAERQQEAQAQREHEQQLKDKEIQAAKEAKAEDRAFTAKENQLDRANRITEKQIVALGFNEDKDMNNNNVPDVMEYEKLKTKQQEIASKERIEQSKLQQKAAIEDSKLKAQKEKDKNAQALEKEKMANKLKEAKIKAAAQKANKQRSKTKK